MPSKKIENIKYKVKNPLGEGEQGAVKQQEDLLFNKVMAESKVKQYNSAVPTYSPKNFYEQFYLYKSGATFRLYVYTDNTWKYVALT